MHVSGKRALSDGHNFIFPRHIVKRASFPLKQNEIAKENHNTLEQGIANH